MRKAFAMAAIGVLIMGVAAQAEDKKEAGKSAQAAFDRLTKLAGDWVALDKDGKPTNQVVSSIKVTSRGSAIQETLFPGQDHEMVTIYHVNGNDLVLTHYCMLHNQPHLKLDPSSTDNKFVFKFVNGANIDPAKDMHMHDVTLTILDDNHIQSEWKGWNNGKPEEAHQFSMKLERKK
jgi:hypothetical protein